MYNSALAGVAFGGILTSTVAYFYQSRIWKRNVSREFSQRNVDVMYSPLYKEVDSIVNRAVESTYLRGYQSLDTSEWDRITGEYYHRYIPEPLKQQLLTFYVLVKRFNSVQQVVGWNLREFITKKASQFYSLPAEGVQCTGKGDAFLTGFTDLVNPILFSKHPLDILRAYAPDRSDLRLSVTIPIVNANGTRSNVIYENAEELERFEQFYGEVSKEANDLQMVKDLRQAFADILIVAPTVRDSLFQIIDKTR